MLSEDIRDFDCIPISLMDFPVMPVSKWAALLAQAIERRRSRSHPIHLLLKRHNALQAMNKCGSLAVSAKWQWNWIRVSITNSEKGILAEILDQIFQHFLRHGKEYGLGLDIVQKIVKRHGGTIEI